MPEKVVQFHGVSKVYRCGLLGQRRIAALCDVTFDVPRGSVFALLGPNRAGKTTLIKALLSICRPTAGSIVRLGRPWHDRGTLALVGYLHESQAFPRYLTATGLLRYYGALAQVAGRDLDRRIPRLLEQVGLADRAREPIATYSKGMAQRLALAQALVNDPQLLVLDEPGEGMDLLARKMLHDVIHGLKAEGKTVILVSHSLDDVGRLCDQAAVLRRGQVAYSGELDGLRRTGDALPATGLEEVLQPMYEGAAP